MVVAVTKATFCAVFLRILAMFYASRIIAAWVLRTMLLAIVLFAAASRHCAAMLCAMLFGAMMFMTGMFCAMLGRTARMLCAMFTMLAHAGAMFSASRIIAVRMSCAMLFAIVLAKRFMLAMADAGFALFTFSRFAMLHAIVFYRI